MAHIPRKSLMVIVGAGFSGIAMGAQLKRKLEIDDYIIYDQSFSLGGTWQANKYPGCGVDIPGPLYSLSFAPNPEYSDWFPRQPEILSYLDTVAQSFDVQRHIRLGILFEHGEWNEGSQSWILRLRDIRTGEAINQECNILVSAIGNLVHPSHGKIAELENFGGPVVHTGNWDETVHLDSKRVAIVGNGCSASQLVPAIAGRVHTICQFMNTPQTYIPSFNPRITPIWQWVFRKIPLLLMICRWIVFLMGDLSFPQYRISRLGDKIRARSAAQCLEYVKATAPLEYWRLLLPSHEKGCKRVIRDHGFLSSLCRPNVNLIGEAIESCCTTGVFTESGKYFPADVIILATGFDTSRNSLDLTGRGGVTLTEHWKRFGGMEAYKSVAVSEFPNFFMLYGPNATFAHSSALFSIETAIGLVLNVARPVLLKEMAAVEVHFEREWEYHQALRSALHSTVWETCSNYYKDSAGRNVLLYPWSATWLYFSTRKKIKDVWRYQSWRITA